MGSNPIADIGFALARNAHGEVAQKRVKQKREYTWPGSNWRPSACEADVIATRPQVLDNFSNRVSITFIAFLNVCS